jgi:hypothetical protein
MNKISNDKDNGMTRSLLIENFLWLVAKIDDSRLSSESRTYWINFFFDNLKAKLQKGDKKDLT